MILVVEEPAKSSASQMQYRLAVQVKRVNVRSGLEQHGDHLHMTRYDGQMDRQIVHTVAYVRTGAVLEQQSYHVDVAARACYVQTCALLVVAAVHVIRVRLEQIVDFSPLFIYLFIFFKRFLYISLSSHFLIDLF